MKGKTKNMSECWSSPKNQEKNHKNRVNMLNTNEQIHDCSLYWLRTSTSIKCGGVKLDLREDSNTSMRQTICSNFNLLRAQVTLAEFLEFILGHLGYFQILFLLNMLVTDQYYSRNASHEIYFFQSHRHLEIL